MSAHRRHRYIQPDFSRCRLFFPPHRHHHNQHSRGQLTFTITGTDSNSSLTHTTNAALVVTGFTLSASPNSQTVNPGGSSSYSVSVGALNGFSDSVNLSVSGLPTGATATFSPTSPAAGSSSLLTVTTTTSTPAGSSTFTITGTDSNSSLTHTTSATLVVSSSIGSSANVISIDFVGQDVPMASTEIAGVVAEPNWNDANSAISSSPLVLVDDTGTGTTATATWTSNDIWELPTVDQPGNARMMKGYLDTGNTMTTTVSVSGLPSTTNGYNVYVYADGDNGTATRTGVYTISGTGITTSSISLTDAASTNFSGTFTQANNSAGNYVVFTINATAFTISATPGASTDVFPRAPVNGIQIVPLGAPTPDFALSVTPSSQTVNPGGSSSYTVSVGALDGFSDSVNLSVSGLPTGATATFSPTSPAAGSSSLLTVTTTTSTPAGSFTFTITGTDSNSSLTHTTNAALVVTGFTLSASPNSQTVNPGGSSSYSVSVGALDGFSDSVNLSVSGLPTGATATFSPTSPAAGSSSLLTVTTTTSTPAGSSTFTITGTDSNSSLTHTTSATLVVSSSIGSSANVISIDFVGQDVPMASTEIAGVVAEPNWNDANSAISSSPLVLVDDTGTGTTATATWTSNDIWELPTVDQPGNARMMKGYLDTGNTTTTTVSVSGLPSTTNGYNVYVYADGDNGTATRTGVYTISGTGITTSSISLTDAASTNFSGTFTQANNSAGNYVVFTINATAFTISATPGASTDVFPRAPVNGIQIVPR